MFSTWSETAVINYIRHPPFIGILSSSRDYLFSRFHRVSTGREGGTVLLVQDQWGIVGCDRDLRYKNLGLPATSRFSGGRS